MTARNRLAWGEGANQDAAAPSATNPGRAAVGIPAGSATPGQLPAGPEPCGHGIGMHDIRGSGKRGACSVITGLKGVRCPCKGGEFA